jgi:3-oxoacyl-[acyl-carrier protein] reductase
MNLKEADMELQDQVAVITGGARGIGAATAKILAREGAHIVIGDVLVEEAKKTAKEIQTMGRKALAVKTDVRYENEVNNLIKTAFDEFGRIDILVNNAGILRFGSIEEITVAEWDEMLNVHLRGAFLCSKAVMPIMKKQKSGKIASLSSCAGKMGGVRSAASYSCAKAGIATLTLCLAKELAPYNVRVNAVAPGAVNTVMMSENYKPKPYRRDWLEQFVAATPLGIGQPEDIGEAILFLVSDKRSRWITGEVLDINGGFLMDNV